MSAITQICNQFQTGNEAVYERLITSGRVNETYVVDLSNGSSAILQKINRSYNPNPEKAISNALAVQRFCEAHQAPLNLVSFFPCKNGGYIFSDPDGNKWRAYRYIDGVFSDPGHPETAALLGDSVGLFHRTLADFPVEKLYASIENFHNTPLRYENFLRVLELAPKERIDRAANEIGFIKKQTNVFAALLTMDLPARVTHNDTKLENLIVDRESGKALGFLDCDTLMPGIFAFDFGDGARSCCRNHTTDDRDIKSVQFRLDLFDAYTAAYLKQARSVLVTPEPASLALGAVVISLELGIRYLTYYLTGKSDFKIDYPIQNLDRARVQLLLCLQMQKQYADMCAIVKKHLLAK